MTVEIPEFKRCCFCLPLRPGLLAWGYFKIIADALITPYLSYFLLSELMMSLYAGNKRDAFKLLLFGAFTLVTLVMFVTDFVAAISFVIGGHKKNVKLIRGFYIYSIVLFIVTGMLIVIAVGISIVTWNPNATSIYLVFFAGYLVILVVQAYFILLLRSEINKLNSSSEFRFVNNSTEAQCIMTSKDKEATVEKA